MELYDINFVSLDYRSFTPHQHIHKAQLSPWRPSPKHTSTIEYEAELNFLASSLIHLETTQISIKTCHSLCIVYASSLHGIPKKPYGIRARTRWEQSFQKSKKINKKNDVRQKIVLRQYDSIFYNSAHFRYPKKYFGQISDRIFGIQNTPEIRKEISMGSMGQWNDPVNVRSYVTYGSHVIADPAG